MSAPRIDRLENGIINAPLEFWQRVGGNTTTVNTATGTSGYTADRIQYGTSGTTVKNFSIQRSTDVPTQTQLGFQVPYSYQFNCLTAIASPAAGDAVNPWEYKLEGYDYARFHGNAATLSFWVKITSSATFPVNLPVAFGNANRTYLTTVSVAANNTWQQCFVNLTFETNAGSYAFDNSLGMQITIGSAAGTSSQGTANVWQSGILTSVSGAFNTMGITGNVMRIAAPQLVLGTFTSTTGLTFGRAGRSAAHELNLCQRYCEVWSGLAAGQGIANGAYTTATIGTVCLPFSVAKRAFPSVTFTNVTSYRFNNATLNNRVTSVSSIQTTLTNTVMNLNTGSTTNGAAIATLDCDNANGAGVIVVDAEL